MALTDGEDATEQFVPPPQAGVRPGDILAGKYRVERVLGVGGMGIVVAAHHLQLDEKVALKFLLPEALKSPVAVARFVREARAAVKIKSEHVARVIDVGTLEAGSPYIVMEYLEGGDLEGWLKQRGALPFEQAVEFVLQACVAIAEAHALGIVHRDLKPANLFCVRRADGQLSIKVLDFGISKVTDLSGSNPLTGMTKTSAVMGTPLYMSPEQLRSAKNVDARADIWALGVILYELLTGQSAFLADTLMELTLKIAEEPPPPLRSLRPDAPDGLEAIILRCVEKHPDRRYRNVAELAVALHPFAPNRATASVERISGIIKAAALASGALDVPLSPHAPSTGTSAGTSPPLSHTVPGVQGGVQGASRPRAIAMGVCIAAMLAVGGVVLVRSVRPNTGAPSAVAASPAPVVSVLVAASASASAEDPPPLVSASAPTAAGDPIVQPEQLRVSSSRPSRWSPPVAHPARSAPATPPPARRGKVTSPSCDPNFTLDEHGEKRFKPECFK
jgi:serine/threonine protein kinase